MKRIEFFKASSSLGLGLVAMPHLVNGQMMDSSSSISPKIVRASEGVLQNVIGDMQTVKLTGKDTNGQFTLIEEENVPGTMIPPHVHTKEDEVFKVLEGEMELTVGNQTTILKAGDLALGPRGVPHSWKIVGDRNAKIILSVFPAGIELMFEELGKLPAGPPDFPLVEAICGRYGIQFLK